LAQVTDKHLYFQLSSGLPVASVLEFLDNLPLMKWFDGAA
jgi:hypothetical protein